MKCPVCKNETKDNKCESCNKSMLDIYFELSEKAQIEKKYDLAIKHLYEARNYTDKKEILEEIERIVKGIQFTRFDIGSDFVQDEGDSTIKRVKKLPILISFIVIILCIYGGFFGYKKYKYREISDKIIDNRKLETTFLFHFNQAISTHADIANKTSFEGLLAVLRKHKNLKFNIHISGTLIQSLLWYAPETLEIVKEGIEDGQFELVGSSYSQNVMYSTDLLSNKWQIQRHREVIKDYFGVYPKGFWNSERTWNQSMAELLLDNGYEYTYVEDHILKDSGTKFPEHILRTTENGKLTIINDDHHFMPIFNKAVDSGDNEFKNEDRGANLDYDSDDFINLFRYMRDIYEKDKNDRYVLSYADDAEITGNWDFWGQRNPDWDFENLDLILSEIETRPWIKTSHLSEVVKNVKPSENLEVISDGAADWMNKASSDATLNYGEGGYKDWFDFNANSMKLKYYKFLHNRYQEFILKYEKYSESNIKKLIKLAKEVFLARQFEFGCTGIGGTKEEWEQKRKFVIFESIKEISVYEELINRIINYKDEIYKKDINADGIEELVVIKNQNFYVFSISRGGRLLYWFDMEKGIEIVGGEMSTQLSEVYFDGNYPTDIIDIERFERFIVGNKDLKDYFENKNYYARQKALNVVFEKDVSVNEEPFFNFFRSKLELEITSENSIRFTSDKIINDITFTDTGFEYSLSYPKDIRKVRIYSEFQPDYFNIVNKGKDVLDFKRENENVTIYNKDSNIGVEINVPNVEKVTFDDSLQGKMVFLEYDKKIKEIKIKVNKFEKAEE